jgi:polysaccharide biosynthesis transport protein
MTTLPTTRPSIPVATRPQQPQAPAAIGVAPIDPIRLLRKYKVILAITAAIGLMVGIGGHFLMLNTYPIYSSALLYQCLPLQGNPSELGPRVGQEKEFEKFMATQVAVLTSDRIIDRTVSDPALMAEAPNWVSRYMVGGAIDTRRAARGLKRNLSAGVKGDTSFIHASFWWTDEKEVAAVLRLVGRNYEEERRLQGNTDVGERRQMLQLAINTSDNEIKKLQETKRTMLQDKDVASLEEQNSAVAKESDAIQAALVQVRAGREAAVVYRDQLQRELENSSGPRIPDTIRRRVEENHSLVQLRNLINQLDGEIGAKNMHGVKPDHPSYRRLLTARDGMQKRYDAERERLEREQFYAELEASKTSVASAEAQEHRLMEREAALKLRAVELTQLHSRIKDLDKEIDHRTRTKTNLAEDLAKLDINTKGTYESRVVRYQDAQIPRGPTFPKLFIMAPLGVFLALVLVGGVIMLIEVVDQRVKGPADLVAVPRARVLGLIPHACEDPQNCERVETVFRDRPASVLSEHFRQLRGQIIKKMAQSGHKTLLVLAPNPDSGTTTVALNLAFAIASTDQRVLVIDGNFRRPSIHKTLGLSEGPGLSDILAGGASLASAVQTSGSVSVLSAGSADTRIVERLATTPMSALLTEAGAAYDIVLIDAPPALVAGDALALANRCDAALLVVRAMADKRGMVGRVRNELGETKADLVGIVVNAVRTTAGGYLKGNIQTSHRYQSGGKA